MTINRRLNGVGISNNGTQENPKYSEFDHLEIELNFTKPLYISASPDEMDRMRIEVTQKLFKFEGNLTYTIKIDDQNSS